MKISSLCVQGAITRYVRTSRRLINFVHVLVEFSSPFCHAIATQARTVFSVNESYPVVQTIKLIVKVINTYARTVYSLGIDILGVHEVYPRVRTQLHRKHDVTRASLSGACCSYS